MVDCAQMKTTVLLSVLILWATSALAQENISSTAANPTPSTLSASHIFSSEMGFDLTYPSDWSLMDLNPALPLLQKKVESRLNSESEKQRLGCVQYLFTARTGDPKSVFIVIGESKACAVKLPSLDSFALGTMTSLKNKYTLTETEYGVFTVKDLTFWVMRTKAAKIDNPEDMETIEYVGTILPQGAVFWSAHCKDEHAKAEFEHAHLHFANGGDTEIIPSRAFRGIKIPCKKQESAK